MLISCYDTITCTCNQGLILKICRGGGGGELGQNVNLKGFERVTYRPGYCSVYIGKQICRGGGGEC